MAGRKFLAPIDVTDTIIVARKSDPGSPVTGEMWINSALLKFRDNSGSPTTRVVEVQSNKDVANGYAGLDANGFLLETEIAPEAHGLIQALLVMGG